MPSDEKKRPFERLGKVDQCDTGKSKVTRPSTSDRPRSRSKLAALLGVALSSACGTYGEVDTYVYKDADGGRPKPGIGIGTVQVAFNRCPEVTSMTVTPLVTGVGGLVRMTATAEDPEGDEVALAWSVSEGEILAGDDEFSTYECETIGFPTVTLEVSDESGCTRANTIVLGCVATP